MSHAGNRRSKEHTYVVTGCSKGVGHYFSTAYLVLGSSCRVSTVTHPNHVNPNLKTEERLGKGECGALLLGLRHYPLGTFHCVIVCLR